MTKKIRFYCAVALMCFGVILILGAAGLSDQGMADFTEVLWRVAIGAALWIAGFVVGC